jgi:hypothetical protein
VKAAALPTLAVETIPLPYMAAEKRVPRHVVDAKGRVLGHVVGDADTVGKQGI